MSTPAPGDPVWVAFVGAWRPGIVRRLTRRLAFVEFVGNRLAAGARAKHFPPDLCFPRAEGDIRHVPFTESKEPPP